MKIDGDKIIAFVITGTTTLCMLSVFWVLISSTIPHGDITTYTGYIIEVNYSQGGYATNSATYVRWADGNTTILSGTVDEIRCNTNATLTYLDGNGVNFFKQVTYGW